MTGPRSAFWLLVHGGDDGGGPNFPSKPSPSLPLAPLQHGGWCSDAYAARNHNHNGICNSNSESVIGREQDFSIACSPVTWGGRSLGLHLDSGFWIWAWTWTLERSVQNFRYVIILSPPVIRAPCLPECKWHTSTIPRRRLVNPRTIQECLSMRNGRIETEARTFSTSALVHFCISATLGALTGFPGVEDNN